MIPQPTDTRLQLGLLGASHRVPHALRIWATRPSVVSPTAKAMGHPSRDGTPFRECHYMTLRRASGKRFSVQWAMMAGQMEWDRSVT